MREQKQFSIKGLAEFMSASPVRQRRILQQHKFPEADEARARTDYYKPARDRIARYHREGLGTEWLHDQSDELDAQAESERSTVRARKLRYNAKGLRAYSAGFGRRKFEILGPLRLGLQYGDVRVSTAPDLHVRENGVERIIKLEFSNDEPDEDMVKIVTQGLFEGAQKKGIDLSSANVLLFDVIRGRSHRGARLGGNLGRQIEATCRNISAIWGDIEVPVRSKRRRDRSTEN